MMKAAVSVIGGPVKCTGRIALISTCYCYLCAAPCRACIKAHKMALMTQRAFWRSVMRDSIKLSDMLHAFKAMQQAEQTAIYVYKRCVGRMRGGGQDITCGVIGTWGLPVAAV